MRSDEFINEIVKKIEDYRNVISNIGFSLPEAKQLTKKPKTLEEILHAIDVIIDSSKELNLIFENSPDSIFVADSEGVSLRINKAFESIAGMPRDQILGRNVTDVEREGIFRPSVCRLALNEKRSISVLQQINNGGDIFVTGTPIFNEKGELYRVTTNAALMDQIKSVTSYIADARKMQNDQNKEVPEIIAESREMKGILNLVHMIKDTDSSIFITGETGVGKSMLAKYIHETSRRSNKKIIEINCGAIPNALLESELFGYEGGAFTGAGKRGKPGLIELSDGGTLFLDEICEMPLLLQVKLLHFLQSKKIIRVGGTREITIDARVIAGSNRSPETQIEAGEFRSDLYYRLNVIPINIAPLRERKEDILKAAEHFISVYEKRYNKKMKVTQEFLESLLQMPWKGNMRELENYVERVIVTSESDCLTADSDHITEFRYLYDRTGQDDYMNSSTLNSPIKENKDSLNVTLDDIEKDLILKTYERYRSSYKVAEELGISQSTAYRKIKKYKALIRNN